MNQDVLYLAEAKIFFFVMGNKRDQENPTQANIPSFAGSETMPQQCQIRKNPQDFTVQPINATEWQHRISRSSAQHQTLLPPLIGALIISENSKVCKRAT